MIRVTFKFDADRAFRKKVTAWRAGLRDLRWAWKVSMPDILAVHRTMFDQEGPGWAPLANLTANMREYRIGYYQRQSSEDPYHKILHWTWSLRDSLTRDAPGRFGHRMLHRTKMHFGTEFPPGPELNQHRPFLRPELSVMAVTRRLNVAIPGWMNHSPTGAPPRR